MPEVHELIGRRDADLSARLHLDQAPLCPHARHPGLSRRLPDRRRFPGRPLSAAGRPSTSARSRCAPIRRARRPGLLDRLNELGVSYRWVCRFLPLDKEDARKVVTTVRKRWFAKRKGVMALLKEAITREPSQLEDPDAAAKTTDADAALAILGGDYASIGYFTPTVTLMDPDPDRLADRVREVESAINRVGFVCKVEDVNAVEAWVGSLPGQAYADLRRPLVSSLNLCDMMPMSAIWPGPTRNAHLTAECTKRGHPGAQPPLMVARTAGTTPFPLRPAPGRRRPHHDRRARPARANRCCSTPSPCSGCAIPRRRSSIFDKGASSRAATLLTGGRFYVLGGDQSDLAFQPLAEIDSARGSRLGPGVGAGHRRGRRRRDHAAGQGGDLGRPAQSGRRVRASSGPSPSWRRPSRTRREGRPAALHPGRPARAPAGRAGQHLRLGPLADLRDGRTDGATRPPLRRC